jgi:hypothetical protein
MKKETNKERAVRMIQFCIDWMRYENQAHGSLESYQKAQEELAYWQEALQIAERN